MAGDAVPHRQKVSVSHARQVNRLERELRESVERYELIFKATNDILYDLNIQTGKVVWNKALQTQFGYPKNDLTSTLEWWVEHIHPEDALYVEEQMSLWLTGSKHRWMAEYRFRKANGTYAYVRDRGYVTRDTAGWPVRIIGSFLDITKQKKLDRAKDEFISLVSHQLRTPLTVIRVYGEMFMNGFFGELTQPQQTHLALMTKSSIKLISLVDDILKASRIELGDFKITPEPTPANELLLECIKEVQPFAESKHVEITFEPDPDVWVLLVDRSIFTQIIENFLSNAIRYTLPQHGRVRVTFRQQGSEYVLCVQDNGIGIPRAAQAYVFDRFYRASNTVNIEVQGTGLGLYLVKLMTAAIRGRVWFDSTPGKGSAFYLALPVDDYRIPVRRRRTSTAKNHV